MDIEMFRKEYTKTGEKMDKKNYRSYPEAFKGGLAIKPCEREGKQCTWSPMIWLNIYGQQR